jgi:hypothetical protein
MKRPANVADLTASLTAAAQAPLVRSAPEPANEPQPKRGGSKAVFLRMPDGLHARYEAEAVARTKATGKGVTVQQVMLEKLEGAL